MNPSIQQISIGFFLSGMIGVLAWRSRSLKISGAIAATLLGGVIFGLGGIPWAILLLTFFISSSALSRLFKQRKDDLDDTFEKGSERDWAQVAANGGIGGFLVLMQMLYPESSWPWLAYAGALAAVNADTWATELGTLSQAQPRLITNWQPVKRGTSGGVTMGGTTASLSGAVLIGLLAGWLHGGVSFWGTLLVVGIAGLAGSLIDSFLGATVQVIYFDPEKQQETEHEIFTADGKLATPLRGYVGINNDVVNFVAGLSGAILAVGLYQLL